MAGRGRGSRTLINNMGIAKDELIQAQKNAPSYEAYPPLQFKPLPFNSEDSADYLGITKSKFSLRKTLQDSKYYLQADPDFMQPKLKFSWDWYPKELHPKSEVKTKAIKRKKSSHKPNLKKAKKDFDIKNLEDLEENDADGQIKEEVDEDELDNDTSADDKEESEDEMVEEEEADDYTNAYFDNGENDDADEDDALEEGGCY